MLLRKDPSAQEVYNDLDGEIVNVFRTLRDREQSARLAELLALTPHARDEFDLAWENISYHDYPVEAARRVLTRAYMSYGSSTTGKYKTGFRNRRDVGGGNLAASWAEYQLARRGKRHFPAVRNFELDAASNLRAIQQSLLEKSFHTAEYISRAIFEPKQRTIYILRFYPDRIVQHALMRVVAPIWEKIFIQDSYACISGRGIHAGSRKTMEFVRSYAYCLKCDVHSFYMSVDHDILMNIIRQKIKCPDTLWLLEDIVRSFPGGKNVPIGNLTSQWFGNLYLNELDHYKTVLRRAAGAVTSFLRDRLKLELSKCDLFPVSRGVDFLGYRHFRKYILLRKSTAKRVKRRLASLPGQFAGGFITREAYRAKTASAWGWMRWANTHNLALHTQIHKLLEMSK